MDTANIDSTGPDGRAALHIAIMDHNEPLLRLALSKGADLSLPVCLDGEWIAPAVLAAREGFLPALKLLTDGDKPVADLTMPKIAIDVLREALMARDNNIATVRYLLDDKGLAKRPVVVNRAFGSLPPAAHHHLPAGTVEFLLQRGLNANKDFGLHGGEKEPNGGLPLMLATAAGATESTRLYLRYGADPLKKNLHRRDAYDALEILQKKRLYIPNICGEIESIVLNQVANGMVPLDERNLFIAACERGDLTAAAIMLANGEDVNQTDKNGRAGIHVAMLTRNEVLLRLLVDHDADVALPLLDYYGCGGRDAMPVELAAEKKFIAGIKFLTEEKGFPLWPNPVKPAEDLLLSARGNVPMLRYLIEEKKLDFQAALKNNGWNFLQKTSLSPAGIEYLLIAGMDPNQDTGPRPGKNRLAAADEYTLSDAFAAQGNAYEEIASQYDGLPLVQAAFEGDVEMVTLYLSYGAEPFRRNHNGKSAWDAISDDSHPFYQNHQMQYAKIEELLRAANERPVKPRRFLDGPAP